MTPAMIAMMISTTLMIIIAFSRSATTPGAPYGLSTSGTKPDSPDMAEHADDHGSEGKLAIDPPRRSTTQPNQEHRANHQSDRQCGQRPGQFGGSACAHRSLSI